MKRRIVLNGMILFWFYVSSGWGMLTDHSLWFCIDGIYKLNIETGKYEYFSKNAEGACADYEDLEHNRVFCEHFSRGFGIDSVYVFDFKQMKVVATLPFTQSGDPCSISLKVSPDGSRIWVEWCEGEGGGKEWYEYRGVFDGRTYKMIKKEKIERGKEGTIPWPWYFSEDGKSYYGYKPEAPPKNLVRVDISSLSIVKNFGDTPGGIVDIKGGRAIIYKDIRLPNGTWDTKIGTWNLESGGDVVKMIAVEYPEDYRIVVSPDGYSVVILGPSEGLIRVYNLQMGVMTVKIKIEPFDEGPRKGDVIYVCPDSSCLIYNNTKELLRFDLREGKLAKRIPIKYPKGCRP